MDRAHIDQSAATAAKVAGAEPLRISLPLSHGHQEAMINSWGGTVEGRTLELHRLSPVGDKACWCRKGAFPRKHQDEIDCKYEATWHSR